MNWFSSAAIVRLKKEGEEPVVSIVLTDITKRKQAGRNFASPSLP